jgi:adenylate kinase
MNATISPILQAVLLLGPTGAGKTPLGEWLEGNGLWGRRCHHFDFGADLRALAAAGPDASFAEHEIHFLRRVLAEGVLLENESFYLAAKLLHAFVARRGIQAAHWLVLNGLPRHTGQARALEEHLRVCAVIQLECDARTVGERLRRDPAGDRALRSDDHHELVTRKLAVYDERTRPLVEFYRQRGTRRIVIPVEADTLPQDIGRQLEEHCDHAHRQS